ncbi:MAG: cob(I)yrinic acid a,c-diamide adenosyltransferase [Patescibacteria group bacterium]
MLYTRKGDNGTTKTFGCNQRISKSSMVAEALGSLDETNSFLGLARSKTKGLKFKIINREIKFSELILEVQQNLFIVQAEVAGSDKSIAPEKIKKVEIIVDEIEKVLPPIKNFFLSGATEISANFDFARTLIRRAERRVIGAKEEGKIKMSAGTLSYLNRLSSLLYALARISSHIDGAKEIKPDYK